jgi:glycosyltransferase involved in cell wall biosynthesis
MKIAILSYWCLDSSIPLAKHLADIGNEVDFYALLPVNANGFVLDYSRLSLKSGFVEDKHQNKIINKNLARYVNNINLRTYLFNRFNGKNYHITIWDSLKLARFVNRKGYDAVHIIGHDFPLYFVHRFIRNKNVIHTLHEVTNHNEKGLSFYQKLLLNYLTKKRWIKLIFNSEISKRRFLQYEKDLLKGKQNSEQRVTTIYFGLYETYLYLRDVKQQVKKDDSFFTVLFFGRIVPYKGIEYLIEAFRNLNTKFSNIKLIVAGSGTPYFEVDTELKNFSFLNRHLSDNEIVELHQLSDVVVCPYTSASQSGIVMTTYLFNKPIIASRVGAFIEVIDDLKTGMLVTPSDSDAIAEAIETLFNNKKQYNDMVTNIKDAFSKQESEFNWTYIATKTEAFYNK